MRYSYFVLLFFLFSPIAQASSYISLGYGSAKSSSDFNTIDDISGKTLAVTYGKQRSLGFAWELMVRRTTFDKSTQTIDLTAFGQGMATVESEMEVLFLGGGFRYFLVRYFNVHAGLGYAKTDMNSEIQGTLNLDEAITDDDSGLGIYYGGGLQLPFGPIQFMVDYTINKFASDVSSNELTFGARLRF